MIQYESQGPGAHCPTGLSLEPVTTIGSIFTREVSESLESISAELTLPCWVEGIHHHLDMQSIAHLNLHQEETRTPQGVHCPEACLLQV